MEMKRFHFPSQTTIRRKTEVLICDKHGRVFALGNCVVEHTFLSSLKQHEILWIMERKIEALGKFYVMGKSRRKWDVGLWKENLSSLPGAAIATLAVNCSLDKKLLTLREAKRQCSENIQNFQQSFALHLIYFSFRINELFDGVHFLTFLEIKL